MQARGSPAGLVHGSSGSLVGTLLAVRIPLGRPEEPGLMDTGNGHLVRCLRTAKLDLAGALN